MAADASKGIDDDMSLGGGVGFLGGWGGEEGLKGGWMGDVD